MAHTQWNSVQSLEHSMARVDVTAPQNLTVENLVPGVMLGPPGNKQNESEALKPSSLRGQTLQCPIALPKAEAKGDITKAKGSSCPLCCGDFQWVSLGSQGRLILSCTQLTWQEARLLSPSPRWRCGASPSEPKAVSIYNHLQDGVC